MHRSGKYQYFIQKTSTYEVNFYILSNEVIRFFSDKYLKIYFLFLCMHVCIARTKTNLKCT